MKISAQLGTRAVWAGEEYYLLQGATQVQWFTVSRLDTGI